MGKCGWVGRPSCVAKRKGGEKGGRHKWDKQPQTRQVFPETENKLKSSPWRRNLTLSRLEHRKYPVWP